MFAAGGPVILGVQLLGEVLPDRHAHFFVMTAAVNTLTPCSACTAVACFVCLVIHAAVIGRTRVAERFEVEVALVVTLPSGVITVVVDPGAVYMSIEHGASGTSTLVTGLEVEGLLFVLLRAS